MISVVIPLYNKEKYINQCIQSVLGQVYVDIEIIIVNDGSNDRSSKIIEQFDDKRITVLYQNNGGPASARNAGIRKAKYDLIALLDADDYWDPLFLNELVKLSKDYSEAILFGSKFINYYPEKKKIFIPQVFRNVWLPTGFIKNISDKPEVMFGFSSSSIIFRKNVALEIGLQNELIRQGEDLDFIVRMAERGMFCICDKYLAYYNQHNDYRVSAHLCPIQESYIYHWLKFDLNKNEHYVSPIRAYCIGKGMMPYFFDNNSKSTLMKILSPYAIDFLNKNSLYLSFPYSFARLIYHLLIIVKAEYWKRIFRWNRPRY